MKKYYYEGPTFKLGGESRILGPGFWGPGPTFTPCCYQYLRFGFLLRHLFEDNFAWNIARARARAQLVLVLNFYV